MKKSTLFIGTSFLGAIKQGYKAILADDDAIFLGFNAPQLVAKVKSSFIVNDGVVRIKRPLRCFVEGFDVESGKKVDVGRREFDSVWSYSDFKFDISEFRKIVFVDMFYRIRPVVEITDEMILMNGVPISLTLLSRLHIFGFNGWYGYVGNKVYGTIPFSNMSEILQGVRKSAPNADIYLIAAPRAPEGTFNLEKIYGDLGTARKSMDFIESFYSSELAKIGVAYLPQPTEILTENGVLTQVRLSRGAHPTRPNLADVHMNQNYGEIFIRKYADQLLG